MANNHECYNDVMTLLTGVKARLIRRTKLTDTLARQADDNDYDNAIISDKELANIPPEIDEIVQRAQQQGNTTPANTTILMAK